MNRIIQAINKIIQDKDNITNVFTVKSDAGGNSEYYFKYKEYKWSIMKISESESSFFLHYYPSKTLSIEEISQSDWQNYTDFITYKSDDIKTQEAIESFSELYQVVQNKLFDFDKVLEDIIKS